MLAKGNRAVRLTSAVCPTTLVSRLGNDVNTCRCESAGIFTLSIQLCEPVGGTISISLANLSSCAVGPLVVQPLYPVLIVNSNQAWALLRRRVAALSLTGLASARVRPIELSRLNSKSSTVAQQIAKVFLR